MLASGDARNHITKARLLLLALLLDIPPLPACRSVCDPLHPSHTLSLTRRLPPSVNPSHPVSDMASLGEDLLSTVNKLQDLVFNTIGNDSLDLPQIVSLPAYGQCPQVNRLIW